MKKWSLSAVPQIDQTAYNDIKAQFGDFLGSLIIGYGIMNLDMVREYYGCEHLSDPMLMKDMDKAVEAVNKAVDEEKKITVFGDYDCDGVTATVMLYSHLEALGADVDFYIPDRSEGFGLNIPALKKIINSGTEVIITVDNGITAIEEADFLRENGISLIITDHHRPNAQLPLCDACVDPNRADDCSPFKDLCGAGVVLKLLAALEGDEDFVLDNYADLACIGTIGDVMPLHGENRYIVNRGLRNIANEQNIGLCRLAKSAGLDLRNVTSTQLAFSICPRINSAGRISHAEKAAQLLLADTEENAARLCEELNSLNAKRKEAENIILSEADRQFAENPSILKERVIVVAGKDWHHGVIGIVCAKIMERYGKPTIVMTVENGVARGSIRSIEGFSVHKMLMECSGLLDKFGGHPKAGGFSLPADKVEEFTQQIYRYAREYYPKMPVMEIVAQKEVTCRDLSPENVNSLEKLEPFGEGNPMPLFMLRNCTLKSKRPLKDGAYTSFEVESGGKVLRGVSFKLPFNRFFPETGSRIDIIAAAEINEYKGITSVNLRMVDYRPSDFREDRFIAASRVYEEICRGEGCDKRLLPRVVPQTREELMKIYDLIRRNGSRMTAEDLAVFDGTVNYCMLQITLDAFAQAGMIEKDSSGFIKIIPAKEKHDLFKEGLLARLSSELAE